MDAHNFLFGDKLERCILYIAKEAYDANTREAYQKAEHKLEGMRTFLVFLSSEGGTPFPTAIIMLQNACSQLRWRMEKCK